MIGLLIISNKESLSVLIQIPKIKQTIQTNDEKHRAHSHFPLIFSHFPSLSHKPNRFSQERESANLNGFDRGFVEAVQVLLNFKLLS